MGKSEEKEKFLSRTIKRGLADGYRRSWIRVYHASRRRRQRRQRVDRQEDKKELARPRLSPFLFLAREDRNESASGHSLKAATSRHPREASNKKFQ